MPKNIVLIGFMGSGKSMTSNRLGSEWRMEVCSSDRIIEEREGLSVAQIFTQKGEAYFRQLEKGVITELAAKNGVIIDCGGGVVTDKNNIAALKKNGVIFYLKASPKSVYAIVKLDQTRPLVQVKDPVARITELMAEREQFYKQADYVIDADFKTIEQIAEQIKGIVVTKLKNE